MEKSFRFKHFQLFKKITPVFILLSVITLNSFSDPQYYNYNTTTGGNAFPFSVVAGKVIQWIYLSGEINQPAPAPSGNITTVYFRCATASITFTNLTIKMGLTTDVTLPTGAFYTGQLDTVYFNPSVTLSSVAGQWMSITLNTPYAYDNTKSLVIEVNQCTASSTGMTIYNTTLTGNRRTYNQTAGGCNYIYQGQSGTLANLGIDIAQPPPNCSFTWGAQTSGTTSLLYSVKAVNDMVCWTAGAGPTVRRTTDGGANWTDGNPNPGVINGAIYNIEAIDANTAWVTTSPSATYIYKTTNGGTNWTQVFTSAGFINAIKMQSASLGIATGDPVAGVWMILATTDGGNTWTQIPTAPSAGSEDGRNNCLQVELPYIWFGTGQGKIYRTTNSGLNWSSVTTTGLTGQVLSVHFNSLALGLGGGATMVKSTDAGGTYSLLTAPGTGNISGIQGYGSEFWYCRGTGIYRTTDGGDNWTQVHTATGTQNDLSFANSGNGCKVGWSVGSGGNIAKMTGTPVGISNNNGNVPENFLLSQNYPNPFNPSTTIHFSLPEAGKTSLVVYDLLGRVVHTLVNDFRNAGSYTVSFDGSNLASGIYFYTLGSGSFKETKKMLLVK